MRLQVSRRSAEELLVQLLSRGYTLAREVEQDYTRKRNAGQFDHQRDVASYLNQENGWLAEVHAGLTAIFPTDLEAHIVAAPSWATP